MSTKPALFDPESYYNRLRVCVRLEDKMRGFFHWLSVRDCCAPSATEATGKRGPLRLVFSAERPEKGVAADVQVDFVRNELGQTSFDLTLQLPREAGGHLRKHTPCRVYLLEQAVLKRLRSVDPSLQSEADDTLPGKVFQNERVATNWEVARILSALPELEGPLDERGRGHFRSVPLPENCPIRCLPADVHIIVVLGAPAEEAKRAAPRLGLMHLEARPPAAPEAQNLLTLTLSEVVDLPELARRAPEIVPEKSWGEEWVLGGAYPGYAVAGAESSFALLLERRTSSAIVRLCIEPCARTDYAVALTFASAHGVAPLLGSAVRRSSAGLMDETKATDVEGRAVFRVGVGDHTFALRPSPEAGEEVLRISFTRTLLGQ